MTWKNTKFKKLFWVSGGNPNPTMCSLLLIFISQKHSIQLSPVGYEEQQ